MRAKVTGVASPITLIVSSLSPSLAAAPNLAPDVLIGGQAWAPPIIQQLAGVDPGGIKEGQPGPLGLMCPSVIAQAYWFGSELGLFEYPTDGSWQGEWGVPCLTQTQSFS